MAVRQYVGARYVPKFYQNSQNPSSMNWEGNRSYEALTVVTYNNDTYISKIPVPAGIDNPAQNPTYWALTGNYNSQFEQYRSDTEKQLEQYRSDTEKAVTGLTEETKNIEESVTGLAEKTKNVEGSVTEIQNKITALTRPDWSEHYVLLIGDSYADARVVTPNYADYLKTYLNTEHFWNISNLGAGFYANGDNTFIKLLNRYEGDKTLITDIIVAGGLNDSDYSSVNDAGYNNIGTAITAFATQAKQDFPNAKLWLAYIDGAIDNATGLYNRYWNKRDLMAWTYKNFAQATGFTWMEGCQYVMCQATTLYGEDRIHPNDVGSTEIAKCMANILRGGGETSTYPDWSISGNDIRYKVCGPTTEIYWSETLITLPDEVSSNTWFDIPGYTSYYFYANTPIDYNFYSFIGNSSTVTYIPVPAILRFTGNKMQLQVNAINTAGTGYANFSKGDRAMTMWLWPGRISVPTMQVN